MTSSHPVMQREKPKPLLIKNFEQFITSNLLSPEQFRELHPDLSREQIARLAGCSVHTVERWFLKTTSRSKPSQDHCFRLGMAHRFLSAN
jgi:AraC-like DNA-binding protein